MINIDDYGQKDLYAALGVKPEASAVEIDSAYKKTSALLNATIDAGVSRETRSGTEARLVELQEAHEVLSNQDKRNYYDYKRDQILHAPAEAAGPSAAAQKKGWGLSKGKLVAGVAVAALATVASFLPWKEYERKLLDWNFSKPTERAKPYQMDPQKLTPAQDFGNEVSTAVYGRKVAVEASKALGLDANGAAFVGLQGKFKEQRKEMDDAFNKGAKNFKFDQVTLDGRVRAQMTVTDTGLQISAQREGEESKVYTSQWSELARAKLQGPEAVKEYFKAHPMIDEKKPSTRPTAKPSPG
jgi:curved DNA-binding protein CbpA